MYFIYLFYLCISFVLWFLLMANSIIIFGRRQLLHDLFCVCEEHLSSETFSEKAVTNF